MVSISPGAARLLPSPIYTGRLSKSTVLPEGQVALRVAELSDRDLTASFKLEYEKTEEPWNRMRTLFWTTIWPMVALRVCTIAYLWSLYAYYIWQRLSDKTLLWSTSFAIVIFALTLLHILGLVHLYVAVESYWKGKEVVRGSNGLATTRNLNTKKKQTQQQRPKNRLSKFWSSQFDVSEVVQIYKAGDVKAFGQSNAARKRDNSVTESIPVIGGGVKKMAETKDAVVAVVTSEFPLVMHLSLAAMMIIRTIAVHHIFTNVAGIKYRVFYYLGVLASIGSLHRSLGVTQRLERLVITPYRDVLFDMCLQVVFPLVVLMYIAVQNNAGLTKDSSDWEITVVNQSLSNVLHAGNSALYSFLFIFPCLTCHFIFKRVTNTVVISLLQVGARRRLLRRRMSRLMVKRNSPITPQNRARLQPLAFETYEEKYPGFIKWLRRGVMLYAILYAAFGLVAIVYQPCPESCIRPLSPFFAFSESQCQCLSWKVNCKTLGLESESDIESTLRQIPSSIQVLRMHSCDINDAPEALETTFPDLKFFELFDTRISAFKFNLSDIFPTLQGFSIAHAPLLKSMPPALLSFGSAIKQIRISHTNIQSLGDHDDWSAQDKFLKLQELRLEYNNMTRVPDTKSLSTMIGLLSLSGNPIASIESARTNSLIDILFLAEMNLTEIDPAMLYYPYLKRVQLENNNIAEIPTDIQHQMLRRWPEIGLSNNPICDASNNDALLPELRLRACKKKICAPTCFEDFAVGDTHCNAQCFNSACNFDNADCDGSNLFSRET